MTLALKYRPQTLDQYLGNEDAKVRIEEMVESVPNAILLHGGTGTGKTTLARIFARMLNGTPTLDDGDVEEVNASEARGIDDIRSLIERARYSPVNKFKVVIVDEAHQFTPQAVEAFLKPLEEPPPNTVYILCTTDPQRFPTKVINRCQSIEIKPPTADELARHLFKVAKLEKQPITKELAIAIAKASSQSVREAMYKLEAALQLLRRGKNPKAALDAVLEEEANTDKAIELIIAGLFSNYYADAVYGVMLLPKEIPAAVTALTKALWAVDFVCAAMFTKQFVTPNSFPSDFNKRALGAAKQQKLTLSGALLAQSAVYAMRKEVMFATTSPASAALSILSTFEARSQ